MKLSVLLISLCSLWAALHAWTEPINLSNTPKLSIHGSIAADRNNRLHVVWSEDWCYHPMRVLYRWSDDGKTWSDTIKIAQCSWEGGWTNIIVDKENYLHVAWMEFARGEVFWCFFDGDTWSTPIRISHVFGSGGPAMAVDTLNRVHMVWDEWNGHRIWHSFYDGDSWSEPECISQGRAGGYADIAADSKNRLHVVWQNFRTHEIDYTLYDDDSWSEPLNISRMGDSPCARPKVAVDSKGNPHVIWDKYSLYYTSYDSNSNSWLPPYNISEGIENGKGLGGSIVVDRNDNVHIVWHGGELPLHNFYGFYDGDTWHTTRLTDPEELYRNERPDKLCIDSANTLHFVWTRYTANAPEPRDIFYSQHKIIEAIDSPDSKDTSQEGCGSGQNFPNPFIKQTELSFAIPKASRVILTIYTPAGEPIKKVDLGHKPAGRHKIQLSLLKEEVGAGIYFYHIKAGNFITTGKMVVVE